MVEGDEMSVEQFLKNRSGNRSHGVITEGPADALAATEEDSTHITDLVAEALRLWASNMELQKLQVKRTDFLIVVNRVLLSVLIVEAGIIIGMLGMMAWK